jgi:hypothetical protein
MQSRGEENQRRWDIKLECVKRKNDYKEIIWFRNPINKDVRERQKGKENKTEFLLGIQLGLHRKFYLFFKTLALELVFEAYFSYSLSVLQISEELEKWWKRGIDIKWVLPSSVHENSWLEIKYPMKLEARHDQETVGWLYLANNFFLKSIAIYQL